MKIDFVACGLLRAHCYVVQGNYQDKDFVLVIDPAGEFQKIQKLIQSPVTHILLTHAHFDHIGALNELHEAYPEAKIFAGESEDTSENAIRNIAKEALGFYYDKISPAKFTFSIAQPDIRLKDNDNFLGFRVISTPGHTKGSICLYQEEEKVLFSGDTLFANGYGRTDLGGSESQLLNSLEKLMALESDTVVYPGHNENTTIGAEKTNLGY